MRRSRQRSGPTCGPMFLSTHSRKPRRPGSEPLSRLPRCPQEDIVASKIEAHRTIVQFTLVQVGGLFAVSQACLLSVFVPQVCPPSGPSYNTSSPWCGGLPGQRADCRGQPHPRVGHVVPPSVFTPLPSYLSGSFSFVAFRISASRFGPRLFIPAARRFTYPEDLPDKHLCLMKENLDWYNDTPFNQQVVPNPE